MNKINAATNLICSTVCIFEKIYDIFKKTDNQKKKEVVDWDKKIVCMCVYLALQDTCKYLLHIS